MKSITTKSAAILLATLVLGFGALRCSRESTSFAGNSELGENAGAAATQDESARQNSSMAMRAWNEGDSFVYEFDTTRGMTLGTADQPGQELRYHVVGRLRFTVMRKNKNEVRLRADVMPTNVEVLPRTDRDAMALVTGTVYVRATTSGVFEGFYFPKEIAPAAQTLLKGIVSSFQMTVPNDPGATWLAVESDVTGQYEATYHMPDSQTIQKSKNQYIRTRGPAGFLPLQKGVSFHVSSSAKMMIGATGWPTSVEEKETLEVAMKPTIARGNITTRATLVQVEKHPEWVGAFPADAISDTIAEAAALAMSKEQADANIVGGRSLATILLDLNTAEPNARNLAQGRMSAFLRMDPSSASRVTDEILHGKGDLNSKKRLIGSLGTAGTKEAQNELAKLLDSNEAGELRVDAAIALGQTKHPTAETQDALDKAAKSSDKEIATTAILAKGSVIRAMNTDKSADTLDAVQELIQGLTNATSVYEKQVYIEALGNTGDPRTFAAIAPYLTDTTVGLRASATSALKFMDTPAADEVLIRALSDNEALVRRAAVSTIPFRPIAGVFEALDALLKSEPEQAVRLAILQGMNTKIEEESLVLQSAQWVMENDPSETVRSYAKQIVDAVKLADNQ